MKPFLTFALLCFLAAALPLRAQTQPPEDQYFDIYSLILKGDRLVEKGKPASAMTNYVEAQKELKQFQEDFPLWNPPVVKYRLGYLEMKISPPEAPVAPAAPTRTRSKPVESEASANPADNAGPVELKMKWPVGKRYEQQFDATMNVAMNIPGQQKPMNQQVSVKQGFAMSVLKERDGGGREIELELLGTKLDVQSGGIVAMSFDSEQPPPDTAGNPIAPYLKRVAGAKLKFLTDASGKFESVEGLEDFLRTIMGPGAADPAQMLKGIPNMGDNWKDIMSNSSGLPDKPVKVGDTWSKNKDFNAGTTSISQNIDYTFKGWETRDGHKCAVIKYSGDVTPSSTDNSPANVQIHLGGTIWFDPDMGMAIDTSTTVDADITSKMGNQSMTQKVNAELEVKLTGVTDIAL